MMTYLVLVPKYRKNYLYKHCCKQVGRNLRLLSERLGYDILEGNLQNDHVHIVIKIPPRYSVSSIVGQLKGKTAIMLHNEYGDRKNTLVQKSFWSRGYFVRTTGVDKDIVLDYVRNQAKKDKREDGNQLDVSW